MEQETDMKTMLAIRLPKDIDQRLEALAKRTGRTKTWYAREAILRHLEDMEDTYIAIDRVENPAKRLTMEEVEKALGVED
jgi:RHH-type rel operon transcriptional repressor/antitoxin RelB